MNKLLNARLYTATAPKSQADRQAGVHVGADGYCLAETRETPLSYIILPNLFTDLVQRLRRAARGAFKCRELGLPRSLCTATTPHPLVDAVPRRRKKRYGEGLFAAPIMILAAVTPPTITNPALCYG